MTSTSIYNIWFQHILFSPLTDHQKAFSFSKNALPSFQITVNHSKSKWSGIMIKFCNLTVLSQQNSWKISSIIFPWLKSVSSPSFQFPYIFIFFEKKKKFLTWNGTPRTIFVVFTKTRLSQRVHAVKESHEYR